MSFVQMNNGKIAASADWQFPGSVYDPRPVVRGWDGALYFEDEVPEPPVEEEKNAAYALIDAATSAAIVGGFDYAVSPGTGAPELLHFSYDSFDQQNFADTANACLLAQSGVEGLPATVTWNGYRNYTAEGGGELVRLSLDPQAFLALYTGGALTHKAMQMEIGGQRKAMIEATGSRAEIATYLQEWGLLKDELA